MIVPSSISSQPKTSTKNLLARRLGARRYMAAVQDVTHTVDLHLHSLSVVVTDLLFRVAFGT